MKAFTLIELLLSISILIILSAVLLINPELGPQKFQLTNGVEQVISDIRRVQTYAVGAKDFLDAVPPGWGIYGETGKNCYVIFADQNGNNLYDSAGEITCDASSTISGSERFERIFLPPSLEIAGLFAGISSVPTLAIVYLPPHPEVLVNGVSQSGQVIIKSKPLNVTKSILVNTVGNVIIQ